MAQPSQSDQGTLKYSINGSTGDLTYYGQGINPTTSLKFAFEGSPVYSPGPGGSTLPQVKDNRSAFRLFFPGM